MKTRQILAVAALLAAPLGAAMAADPSAANSEALYQCRLDNLASACATAEAPRIVTAPRASPGSYANKRMLDGASYQQAEADSQGLHETAQARIVDDAPRVASGSYASYQRLQGGAFTALAQAALPDRRVAAARAGH